MTASGSSTREAGGDDRPVADIHAAPHTRKMADLLILQHMRPDTDIVSPE